MNPTDGWQPLHPTARWLFHLQSLAGLAGFWLPVLIGGTFAASFAVGTTFALVGGGVGLFGVFLLALWYPSLSFDRWSWALREDDLVIRSGVFFLRTTAIPLGRIQHVDVRQGPLEQGFGLGRLLVFTAAGMGADGVVPGLALDVAEALRDRLVTRAQGDDGV